MKIQVKTRGKGKTYWCVEQALINNGIVVTRAYSLAEIINKNILPEVIKDLEEKTNINYNCEEIVFSVNDPVIYSETNKGKPIYVDEIDYVLDALLKYRFRGGAISSEHCDYDVDKDESEKICESVVRHAWELPAPKEEQI